MEVRPDKFRLQNHMERRTRSCFFCDIYCNDLGNRWDLDCVLDNLCRSTAFTALALFNSLRTPLTVMPDIIVKVMDALVSLKRVEDYLAETQLDESVNVSNPPIFPSSPVEFLESSSFSWSSEKNNNPSNASRRFTLKEISVKFPKGRLSVIHGPTGSGKSSILAAILGGMTPQILELNCLSGGISLYDGLTPKTKIPIAFAPQEVWLQNATIRNNIIFGTRYESKRYAETIQACALVRDFENLEDGDMTEVGEKGVNLSGGQKV